MSFTEHKKRKEAGFKPGLFLRHIPESLVRIFHGLVDPEACGVVFTRLPKAPFWTAVTDDPRLAEAVPGGSDKTD